MEPDQLEPTAKIETAVMFDQQSPWIPIAAIVISSTIVSLSFLVIYTFCDRKRKVMIDITLPKRDLGTTITFLGNAEIEQTIENKSQNLQLTDVALLVLYMIYALLFTFSTMFGVLYLLQNHNAANLTLASNTSEKLQNWIKSELQRMHIYEERETLRILNLTQEQLEECACHLNTSLNDAIQKQREILRQNLMEMYQPNGTIQLTIENYFQKVSEQYHKQNKESITDFNDTLAKNLHKMHTGYGAYMGKVTDNGWLEFPREVFLKQLYDEGQNISNVSDKLEEFMSWMEIDNVGGNAYILNRLLELMPSVDVSSLQASALVPARCSEQVSISWFTFISHSTLSDLDITRPDQTDFQEIFKQPDESITNSMKQILYPVVIGVFVFLDIFILANRFFWALKCLQQFKKGIRNNIPTDSITRKIHFILTGIGYEKPDHTNTDLYQLYNETMAEFWGKNPELYILYCQSSPESQKDILLEMRSHKQSIRAKISTVKKTTHCTAKSFTECLQKYTIYLYRLLISRFFWKFTLISAFYLFLCFVAKGTDDLVTLEMASFLTDTETMLNILKSQSRITNSVIVQYCDHLNKFLREYQSYLDKDLDSINYLIQGFLTEQTVVLKKIVASLCSLGRDSTCDRFHVDTTTSVLTNCQLLSIHPQLYTGFQDRVFTDYVSSQLSPLVTSLRSILFNTVYVLLMFTCLMIVCQILARIIYLCLLRSNQLQVIRVYQRPSALNQWEVQEQAFHDTLDGSQSLNAESCESGVFEASHLMSLKVDNLY